jgi:hypothetical protein
MSLELEVTILCLKGREPPLLILESHIRLHLLRLFLALLPAQLGMPLACSTSIFQNVPP